MKKEMYAIVEIAGQQFKVEEGKKIFVHKLEAESGKKVEFDQVLLIEDKGKVVIGEPVIKDALVEGKVLEQLRGDKVIVFKKKRKKGYRVKNGHRQYFTQVEIVSIKEKAVRKSSKKDEAVAEEHHAEVASAEVAAEKKPAVKKSTAKTEEAPKTGKGAAKKGAEETKAEKKPATKKTSKE
ncbi:MAG: 50S ribosomal protein L21 [Bacteroidales bacterium]